MNNLDSNTIAMLTVVAVLMALAVLAWATQRGRQTERLRQRFGTEYARTVDDLGSREKAEAELLERERRVQRLHIKPLSADDGARFAHEWKRLQARFVDDPRGALSDADLVVRELMMVRGYPMADFERRAGVDVDPETLIPTYDPDTCESNVPGLYIAGTLQAGRWTDRIFIENSRDHGPKIVEHLKRRLG